MAEPKPVLVQVPSIELRLIGSDGIEKSYRFYFYQATWTGGVTRYKGKNLPSARYMCHCNTVGCQEVYGEGLGWHRAMTDCLNKLVAKGIIES